ncbi:2,6-beta-D-fructofuranosidase [bacterium]|nr:MAG: 2,6-beta-D-fructofuranosidase [bacterium]
MFLTVFLSTLMIPPSEVLIADFEAPTYGKWTATGMAFGIGPARGALPDQMRVDGFRGKGLVNSYWGGDASTGTLTSPSFTVQRKKIKFLVGGGKDSERLRIDLIVDGRAVRTATGPNDKPGGSEALAWGSWDVEDFAGRKATIQIVDNATGGWGHINVDHIVQSDQGPPALLKGVERTIRLDRTTLNLPVKNGAPKRWVTISVPGEEPRRFDIELAEDKPDWWAFTDVTPWKGKTATIRVDELPEDSKGLAAIEQADGIKDAKDLYSEALRPQFHFTSRRGWLNDPNGLVFYKGEYHLFYQHNPYGWGWGNMSWGHAVSSDLVHWRELPVALHPDPSGTMFSGSAVVDRENTAGFKTGAEDPLVALYTAAGKPFTQGLAYSNDRGRTWTKYVGNPVLGHVVHENRDPKAVWHAPTRQWIIALYMDGDDFALYSSPDMKEWKRFQTLQIPGTTECPNFFPMPLDGDKAKTKWVFLGAHGGYLVGDFDGAKFTPDGPPKRIQEGNCWYAAQVFSDIPDSDGRTVLIPWGQQELPGMPFNQIMGIPVQMTLRSTPEGATVFSVPVRELEALRTSHQHWDGVGTAEPGDLAEVEVVATGNFVLSLRGVTITYDAATEELTCLGRKAKLARIDGKVRLRCLVDRTTIDIFGNDGRLYMPMGVILDAKKRSVAVAGVGIESFDVYKLKSSWR